MDWREHYQSTLYTISHDFGAPLRHVHGFAELLAESSEGLNDEQIGWIRHIVDANALSRAMLDGVLRLSRVHTRRVIDLAPVGVELVVDQLQKTLGAEVTLNRLGPKNTVTVRTEPVALAEVVQELVTNANLHAGGAEVSLGVSLDVSLDVSPGVSLDRAATLEICVRNRCGSLSPEQWRSALEPLSRLGQRQDVAHVGVGLPIAQALAEKCGATLSPEHDCVYVRLPLQ